LKKLLHYFIDFYYHLTMVDEDIGCCATIQKWLIFIVNIILFIFGVTQMGIAAYILSAGTDSLGFAADVFDGDDSAVQYLLASGIIIAGISFLGCCGASKESKCLLWMYAFVLFFMIMGQAMTVAVTAVSVEYGDSIFGEMWKELDAATIDNIQQTYECCSFNGDNPDSTWQSDITDYTTCAAANPGWTPMQSCWGKFERTVNDNYCMVQTITSIFLGVQVLIYFSTHYVIQSIAEAEGVEEEREMEMGGAPKV